MTLGDLFKAFLSSPSVIPLYISLSVATDISSKVNTLYGNSQSQILQVRCTRWCVVWWMIKEWLAALCSVFYLPDQSLLASLQARSTLFVVRLVCSQVLLWPGFIACFCENSFISSVCLMPIIVSSLELKWKTQTTACLYSSTRLWDSESEWASPSSLMKSGVICLINHHLSQCSYPLCSRYTVWRAESLVIPRAWY